MNIRTQTAPSMINQPKVSIFNKGDFDTALWGNGYDVVLERAISCPCKGLNADARPTCNNCNGLGWVFINPVKTRAFIQSINKNTKYKDWSPEAIGTITVTFMVENRFGFMDKISLTNNTSIMSETLHLRNFESKRFVFCSYKPKKIDNIYLFNGDDEPLLKLLENDYAISLDNEYVVTINPDKIPVGFNGAISIDYHHSVTYNIIDMPHDMRASKEYDGNGKRHTVEMPIQAIARKSQYELGIPLNASLKKINNVEEDFANDFNQDFPSTAETNPLPDNNLSPDFNDDFIEEDFSQVNDNVQPENFGNNDVSPIDFK